MSSAELSISDPLKGLVNLGRDKFFSVPGIPLSTKQTEKLSD